jgi:hypothetical protein
MWKIQVPLVLEERLHVFCIRIGLSTDLDLDSAIYLSTDLDLGFPIAREV